jgi:hypothetical protein
MQYLLKSFVATRIFRIGLVRAKVYVCLSSLFNVATLVLRANTTVALKLMILSRLMLVMLLAMRTTAEAPTGTILTV